MAKPQTDIVPPDVVPAGIEPGLGPESESELVTAFKICRRVSTPLVAIETPDPASTVSTVRKVLSEKTPVFAWDCARGLSGENELGRSILGMLTINLATTVNLTETLLLCAGYTTRGKQKVDNLPELSVIFLHNAHRQLAGQEPAPIIQALWNLRDLFKMNKRMVVLLGTTFQLPPELAGDVVVLDEPLPTRGQLSTILDMQHKNASLPIPDPETRTAALDAIVGLPYYTAEQVVAMSLRTKGIDLPRLWGRKVKAIENTEGLRVWKSRANDTAMSELKGIDNVVSFMELLIVADAFGAIVFIDEMDKALAGGMSEYTGDSGVSKDQVNSLLTYIEDNGHLGVLLAGIAGTGKTQLAKAVGQASGKPVIVFDLGAMKGGIVGQSERLIRAALKVVTATAEGRVLFIGTANRTAIFTPEMNRRFPDQFFYDVPDDLGRAAIWPVYIQKNGLRASQARIPQGFDAGWTGAEIRRACEKAAMFGKTVVEAAQFIVPTVVSQAPIIEQMRRDAAGRFLSASYSGFYQLPEIEVPAEGTRAIDVN